MNTLMGINTSTFGRVTDIQAQIMVLQAYDSDYGLDTGHYSVNMCEEEKLSSGSLDEYWAREFKRCRIWETWHISFDDFMDRPREKMKMLCRLAVEDEMKKLTEGSEVENLLKQKGIGFNQ